MSIVDLHFMGMPGHPENFRARVYGVIPLMSSPRAAMLDAMASEAGWVELDSPAYDRAVAALRDRGWLDSPTFKTCALGKVAVWRLTAAGKAAWKRIKPENA